jgi:hypothetical protein
VTSAILSLLGESIVWLNHFPSGNWRPGDGPAFKAMDMGPGVITLDDILKSGYTN